MEMENEKQIVNESVANSKTRITNKDLIELGFPEFLIRKPKRSEIYHLFGKSYLDTEVVFYNALYALVKIYQKYTGKNIKISHSGYRVYLNEEEVFYSYLVKIQKLNAIKKMVKELLITKFNGNFEALKKEFEQVCIEEQKEIESDGIEIFNRDLADKLTQDKRVKYLNIVELLETKFNKKELFLPSITEWFGEAHYLRPIGLKLKDVQKSSLQIIKIKLYQNQNLLFLRTTNTYYAIKLEGNEKQELLDLLNSLEIGV